MLNNSLYDGGYYNFSPHEFSGLDLSNLYFNNEGIASVCFLDKVNSTAEVNFTNPYPVNRQYNISNSSLSNINVTSLCFNYEAASPSLCSLSEAEALAIEVLRIGWVISSSIENKIRNSIGKSFLANTWQNDPAWGSQQKAFNQIGKKVADFAICSARGVFQHLQEGWSYLKEALKNEQPAEKLRGQVIHDPQDLGEFSDTPLIVSEKHFNFPNVVTSQEFEKVQEIYEAIKKGSSGIKIEGSDHYIKSVLKDLRIILSTVVGRELISSLSEKNLPIREWSENEYVPKNSLKGELLISNELVQVFFGAPDADKISLSTFTSSGLFHELTHAYHHLITQDIMENNCGENYEGNPWSNKEEKRTILKTNEFLRQLKAGDENWHGTCYHVGLPSNFRTLNFWPVNLLFLEYKISLLLAYKLRIDEKTTVSDSINELYNTYIVEDPNYYLPSIAQGGHYDLMKSILESTPSEDLETKILEEAFFKASIGNYEEILQLLTRLYPTTKCSSFFAVQSLLALISIENHSLIQNILDSCNLKQFFLNFKSEDLKAILSYLISNNDEKRALLLLNSIDLNAFDDLHILRIILDSYDKGLLSITEFICQRRWDLSNMDEERRSDLNTLCISIETATRLRKLLELRNQQL